MPDTSIEALAVRVRHALENGNLAAYADLLHPEVRWGAPDDDSPSCTSRSQVLAWYRRRRDEGVRADVSEVTVTGSCILVGLTVSTTASPGDSERWQVLKVRDGLIVDIRAYDDRDEARTRAAMG